MLEALFERGFRFLVGILLLLGAWETLKNFQGFLVAPVGRACEPAPGFLNVELRLIIDRVEGAQEELGMCQPLSRGFLEQRKSRQISRGRYQKTNSKLGLRKRVTPIQMRPSYTADSPSSCPL